MQKCPTSKNDMDKNRKTDNSQNKRLTANQLI